MTEVATPKLQTRKQFATWNQIALGTYHSEADVANALVDNCSIITVFADEMLKKITLATAQMEIDLVRVSAGELGFEKGGTCAQIYARSTEYGLDLVPAEAGPQLCLQLRNLSASECVLMAMEPISDSEGGVSVFGVGLNDGQPWLFAAPSNSDDVWSEESLWVFGCKATAL